MSHNSSQGTRKIAKRFGICPDLEKCLAEVRDQLIPFRNAEPSLRCIELRTWEADIRLQRKGFSPEVSFAASQAARETAMGAIASGAVKDLKNRGAWFWKCALHFAFRFDKDERGFRKLIKSGALTERADRFDLDTVVVMRPILRNAFKRLPRKQRIAVLRCCVGGHSITSVAKKLQVGFRRTKRLLRDGLVTLRRSLLPDWQTQMAMQNSKKSQEVSI